MCTSVIIAKHKVVNMLQGHMKLHVLYENDSVVSGDTEKCIAGSNTTTEDNEQAPSSKKSEYYSDSGDSLESVALPVSGTDTPATQIRTQNGKQPAMKERRPRDGFSRQMQKPLIWNSVVALKQKFDFILVYYGFCITHFTSKHIKIRLLQK
jgi:hypothetical protein